MPRTRNGTDDDGRRATERERPAESDRDRNDGVEEATRWFATATVRAGLTAIGAVVLLFALGQAVGLPLLELATDALASQTGQWLVVAFLAVLLIGAAQKVTPSG